MNALDTGIAPTQFGRHWIMVAMETRTLTTVARVIMKTLNTCIILTSFGDH